MGKDRTARFRIVPLALLALLLIAASAGSILHHHDRSEFKCQVCHLGHQAAEPASAKQHLPAPDRVEKLCSSQDPIARPGPVFRRSPSRAPPSA